MNNLFRNAKLAERYKTIPTPLVSSLQTFYGCSQNICNESNSISTFPTPSLPAISPQPSPSSAPAPAPAPAPAHPNSFLMSSHTICQPSPSSAPAPAPPNSSLMSSHTIRQPSPSSAPVHIPASVPPNSSLMSSHTICQPAPSSAPVHTPTPVHTPASVPLSSSLMSSHTTSSSSQTLPADTPPDFPYIPTPFKEKKKVYKRREKGFTCEWGDNVPEDEKFLFAGIEEVEVAVWPLNLSCDGISASEYSPSNSVWACTMFAKSTLKIQSKQGIDGNFIFLCRADSPYKIPGEHATQRKEDIYADELIDDFSNWILGMDTSNLKFKTTQSQSNMSPSYGQFRILFSLVLEEIKKYGLEGFAIRRGRKLIIVKTGVLNIVADLPATNTILDSSGLKESAKFCWKCDFETRYFDPILGYEVPSINHTCFNARRQFKTYNTAFTHLDPHDDLRLLPIALYIRANNIDISVILNMSA